MFSRLMLATALGVALPFSLAMAAAPKVEAPAGTYAIDPTHASVTWKVKHLGMSYYTARFTKLDATLTIDPAKPELATVTATVDPTSVKTDFPMPEKKDFDKELATDAKWFNGTQFPAIVFTSTKVEKTGDATAKLHGDLNFLGVNKPLVLDVAYNGSMKEHPYANKVGAIGFSATGTLNRSDFGMNNLIPYVGDEVQLIIEAEFIEQKPAKKAN